jgi:hypothetical protein
MMAEEISLWLLDAIQDSSEPLNIAQKMIAPELLFLDDETLLDAARWLLKSELASAELCQGTRYFPVATIEDWPLDQIWLTTTDLGRKRWKDWDANRDSA